MEKRVQGILHIGELVVVEGRSQKGKNRIHEHGAVWKCRRAMWNGKFLLESTDGKDNWRWVEWPDDPDFRLVKVYNPNLDEIMNALNKENK